MAGSEIDAMNKKIDDHDANVRSYNNLLSQIKVELDKRLISQ